MTCLCEQCKFYRVDDVWDEDTDDEYEECTCSISGEPINYNRQECEHFKKYKPKKYVEKYSDCDRCERLQACIADGKLLEITVDRDTQRHYMRGLCCFCPKEKEEHT